MSAPLKAIDGNADLPALMTELASRARAAARVLALASPEQKNRALEAIERAIRANAADDPRRQCRGRRGSPPWRRDLSLHRSPDADPGADRCDGRWCRDRARDRRSRRPRHRELAASERHDHRTRAGAARRRRGDFRKPPQRRRRRRRAVPEIRQCGDPARRLRQFPLLPRDPRLPGAGSSRGRPARGCDHAGADAGPRGGRPAADRIERRRGRDRAARRQEPGRPRRGRGPGAGVRASGRRQPRLCRCHQPIPKWPSRSC